MIVATFIGFNYGANLALFPSFTKDLWGISHFGLNYGLVFTAWGIGGFVMSRVSQSLVATTGRYDSAFIAAGIMLILSLALLPLIKDRRAEQKRQLEQTAN